MKLKITNLSTALSFGQVLTNQRLALGLTIDKITSDFFIPKSFVQAMEADKYERLPDKVYTQAILKKYFKLLGLPVQEYLAMWEESYIHWQKLRPGQKPNKNSLTISAKSKWHITPSFWQRGLIAVIAMIFLIYIGLQVEAATQPTSLTVVYPVDELSTNNRSVEVWGETETEAKLLINNQEVTVDVDGRFTKSINLQKGLNILSIEAFKKYRPSQSITRHVFVVD